MTQGRFQPGQQAHNCSDLSSLVQAGQMFGKWRVVSSVVSRDDNGYRMVLVECTGCSCCAWKAYDNLRAGKSTACLACRKTKIPRAFKWLERRYASARSRCENPNDSGYARYGGRGIRMEFASALEYIEYVRQLEGCARDKEIDRIDNNGHYAPGNLRFVSRSTNAMNTRRAHDVEVGGVRMPFQSFVLLYTDLSVQWARRLRARGLSVEELINYRPAAKGRRAQNIRLGKLRPKNSVPSSQ
jgi:hypothetical protein